MSKRDVLALVPSGGGKSLTFQLPAITEEGVTIVIMPLLSLIEDQIYTLSPSTENSSLDHPEEFHIPCMHFEGNKCLEKFLKKYKEGKTYEKIIYMTPEKMMSSPQAFKLLRLLYENKLLERMVIDEIH